MDAVRPKEPVSGNSASWAAIAVLAFLVAALEIVRPLPIAPSGLVTLAIAVGTLGAVAAWYRHARPQPRFEAMCVAIGQMILFSAVGIVLSYLVARTDAPIWDDTLRRWDRAIGFDWFAYLHWVDRSATLTAAYRIAYASLIPQIVALVCALGFAGRLHSLRAVMFAAILCGGLCVLVSAFFPAVSYPAHLNVGAADFVHVNPWGGHAHMADLTGLRDGTLERLNLAEMEGIITFPSYHAGLSAVTFWGFWLTRRWWLQIPGMLLAATTILATPVDGGHYLVDVIAGLAIAVASIAVSRRAIGWNPAWPAITAWPSRRSRAASAR